MTKTEIKRYYADIKEFGDSLRRGWVEAFNNNKKSPAEVNEVEIDKEL